MFEGRFRGWISRGSGLKNRSHHGLQQSSSDSDDQLLSDIRAGGENTRTAQTTLVFLHLVFCHGNIVQEKEFSILFGLGSPGLCLVFRAQTFWDFIGAVLSPRVIRRQYWERKVVVSPFYTHTLHCEHTPWFGHSYIHPFTRRQGQKGKDGGQAHVVQPMTSVTHSKPVKLWETEC